MSVHSTETAVAAVRAATPETLSRDEAERLLGDVRRLRSWLDTVEIATARRLRELNAAGRAECAESVIAKASGCTGRSARDVADRTDLCDEVPTLGESLAAGDMTVAHLDAINAAGRSLPHDVRSEYLAHSDDLQRRAQQVGVEAFARECRALARHVLAAARNGSDTDELEAQQAASNVKRWVDKVTGMHHTHLELDPLRDARLSATFNAELARLRVADASSGTPWQQLQVDAFINAVEGIRTPDANESASTGGTGSRPGSQHPADSQANDTADDAAIGVAPPPVRRRVDRVPQVTLLVSLDWLTGHSTDGICETENGVSLPISTARRLCCDAEVIPTVLGSASEVLDQGRSVRTATEAQRRALRTMHRGCAYPECGVGFDACRIHHVRWWGRDNGSTDLANLLPVCERHHHVVHEGGWSLTINTDRIATWTRPDGVIHHTGPTINRTRAPMVAVARSG